MVVFGAIQLHCNNFEVILWVVERIDLVLESDW